MSLIKLPLSMIILSLSNTIVGKAMGNKQKPIHPAWLSNPTILKFCYPSYMAIKTLTSKHCYPYYMAFSTLSFKNL